MDIRPPGHIIERKMVNIDSRPLSRAQGERNLFLAIARQAGRIEGSLHQKAMGQRLVTGVCPEDWPFISVPYARRTLRREWPSSLPA